MLKTSYLVHNNETDNSTSIKLSALNYALLCAGSTISPHYEMAYKKGM